MLQDGVAWTKLPRGARSCPTPVQYLAPCCGGGRRVSQYPRAGVGPRTPPPVSRVSRSCPKCGDRGQPSCVIKLVWVCPAEHWGGQRGDAPSPHPKMWGSLPPLKTCACGLVGFFLNYFKLEKKKKI